jgi:hypothetical protein
LDYQVVNDIAIELLVVEHDGVDGRAISRRR